MRVSTLSFFSQSLVAIQTSDTFTGAVTGSNAYLPEKNNILHILVYDMDPSVFFRV